MTLAGMTVLLAEDNPTNQMVAMHMLESLGAEITVAADGAEALSLLSDRSFDVALIDIEMPRISGLDVIRRLRASGGAAAAMPMIALTAYVMREHRAAIEDAGADGIIAKPILSIETFGEDISRHMRQRASRPVPPPGATAPGEAPDAARPAPGPVPAAIPEPVPAIDRVIFDGLWASFDPSGRRELGSRVTVDIGNACETLAAAIHGRDFGGVRAATHALVPVAGAIGAVRLQELSERLNSAGQAADDSSLDEDGADLLIEAERVLRFIRREQREVTA